jgi:hypothetical protein
MTQSTEVPASPLMAYLLTMLSALMAPGLPDPALARLAAREAIAAYQARDMREQMTVVQILAFITATLETLRLSMQEDLSLTLKLRLQGSARGLNLAARDTTKLLDQSRPTQAVAEQNLAEQAAAIGLRPAEPAVTPEAPKTTQDDRLGLARAMQTVASRLQASKDTVSSAQRKFNAQWAETLTDVASEIARGTNRPLNPGLSKAELLRTTLMPSGPGIPSVHTLK